jgi:hypothetical protein
MGLGGILIEDRQVDEALEFTNFGPNMDTTEKRKMAVARAVLKSICDYANGNTMTCIIHELRLTKTLHGKPTKAAKRWMYEILMK